VGIRSLTVRCNLEKGYLMNTLARWVTAHRWWVLAAWLILSVAGGFAAPKATSALSYDFGLPGQAGYETNQQITATVGSGGNDAPILLVVGDGTRQVTAAQAGPVVQAVMKATPGARMVSFAQTPSLRSKDGRTGVVMVYPRPVPGPDRYAAALPALQQVAGDIGRQIGVPVVVTGQDALAAGGGSGGSNVLVETLFGGVGALVVLVLVFGSFLALMPLAIAIGSILTTFLIVWGLTGLTDVSFIVQYLLALIGLGVAIDYALLIVTRWREERGRGADNAQAVEKAMTTAGRAVLFSGTTVAVSLAALIALPVPFLRSVGFTGLLIPVISVIAALTLLPALLLICGDRLAWPHRRKADPESRLWRHIGRAVVAHRWIAAAAATVLLLALASPALGLRLGPPTNASLASTGGAAATAISRLDQSGLGAGLSQPVEILTAHPDQLRTAMSGIDGVQAVIAPATWTSGGTSVVDVWTTADASTDTGPAPRRPAARAPPPPPPPPPPPRRCPGRGGPGAKRRLHHRCLRQCLVDRFDHHRRHLRVAGAGVALDRAADQGLGSQRHLHRRRVRHHRAHLAARIRHPSPVRAGRLRRHHRLGTDRGVRVPVRPIHGLRGVPALPDPGGTRPGPRHR